MPLRVQKHRAISAFARASLSGAASARVCSIQPETSSGSGRLRHIPERIAVWSDRSAYELAHFSRSAHTASDRCIAVQNSSPSNLNA